MTTSVHRPPWIDADTRTLHAGNYDYPYAAEDFVNPEYYDRKGKAYVFHDAGFVQAIVFSEYPSYCEQDALDEAVDSGKLDHFQVKPEDMGDYQTGEDSDGNPEYDRIAYLGNAGEPFDIETLDWLIIPASTFEEDTVLMTPDRVLDRLHEMKDDADRDYQKISSYDDAWSAAYDKLRRLEDAVTIAFYAQRR
jgi:hypothetical protein